MSESGEGSLTPSKKAHAQLLQKAIYRNDAAMSGAPYYSMPSRNAEHVEQSVRHSSGGSNDKTSEYSEQLLAPLSNTGSLCDLECDVDRAVEPDIEESRQAHDGPHHCIDPRLLTKHTADGHADRHQSRETPWGLERGRWQGNEGEDLAGLHNTCLEDSAPDPIGSSSTEQSLTTQDQFSQTVPNDTLAAAGQQFPQVVVQKGTSLALERRRRQGKMQMLQNLDRGEGVSKKQHDRQQGILDGIGFRCEYCGEETNSPARKDNHNRHHRDTCQIVPVETMLALINSTERRRAVLQATKWVKGKISLEVVARFRRDRLDWLSKRYASRAIHEHRRTELLDEHTDMVLRTFDERVRKLNPLAAENRDIGVSLVLPSN